MPLYSYTSRHSASIFDVKKCWDCRVFLKILWFCKALGKCGEVVGYRFLRVVFSLTSSPFLLNGTIRHHLGKYIDIFKALVEKLLEDLYDDDIVSGVEAESESEVFYDNVKIIMLNVGFNLRKCVTNSKESCKSIWVKSETALASDSMKFSDSIFP